MRTFKVWIAQSVYYYAYVEAESPDEAESKVWDGETDDWEEVSCETECVEAEEVVDEPNPRPV